MHTWGASGLLIRSSNVHFQIPSDGVDRDGGGKLGHGARARKDTETECLSWHEPRVPIPLHSPNPPRLTVSKNVLS